MGTDVWIKLGLSDRKRVLWESSDILNSDIRLAFFKKCEIKMKNDSQNELGANT